MVSEQGFRVWLLSRGIQPPDGERLRLALAQPVQMGVLSALLAPWHMLLERLRDEPEVAEEELPAVDEVEAYLGGEWLPVVSSNVEAIHWIADEEKLEIEFKNGAFYEYANVTEDEARDFATARSPGGWVWDHLRVRGPGNVYAWNPAHPYAYISAPSRYTPRWMRTLEKRILHGKIRPEGIYATEMVE